MLRLARQGVFWTVQGEGHFAGEPMVFVRLAGCSVGCDSCDTNYQFHSQADEQDVVRACLEAKQQNGNRAKYVWITGGEPTDQDLTAINSLLWQAGFKPCLATAGTRLVESKWWCLSVSPHTADFKQRSGYEVKLVPGLNGLCLDDLDTSGWNFGYWWVQPMAGSRPSLDACCRWLKKHHHFRMSPQSHKSWGMP